MTCSRAHSPAVAAGPPMEVSEELAALFDRADLAAKNARFLVHENYRLRQAILWRLDSMIELDFVSVQRKQPERPSGHIH